LNLSIRHFAPHPQASLSEGQTADAMEKSIFFAKIYRFTCIFAFFVVPLQRIWVFVNQKRLFINKKEVKNDYWKENNSYHHCSACGGAGSIRICEVLLCI
jgi:hypothetical protein